MRGWGVDGCRHGWFFVGVGDGEPEFGVAPRIEDLIERVGPEDPVLIDIPIGLRASGGGRACDVAARKLLGPRRSSVFPAPSRPALQARTYEEANALNREAMGRGLSRQSWGIVPKIREVDDFLRDCPELRGQVREIHPEICFWGLAGAPMQHSKKTREGFEERMEALVSHDPAIGGLWGDAFVRYGGLEAQRDDIVDALAGALCAVHAVDCETLPEEPEIDPEGLRMEMVYWPGVGR